MQMVWLLGRVGGGEGRGLLEQNTKVGISQKKKKNTEIGFISLVSLSILHEVLS